MSHLSAIKDPAKAADAVRRLRDGASPADIFGGLMGSGGSGGSGAQTTPSGRSDAPSETAPLGNVLKGAPPQLPKGGLEQGIKGFLGR